MSTTRKLNFFYSKDSFYYHLTYDPYQKSIVADKGEIRVGQRYQTEIPARIKVTPNGSILEDPNSSATKQSQELERNDRVLRSQLQKMTSNGGSREPDQPEVPMSVQSEELLWLPSEQEIALSSASSYYGITNKLDDRDIDKFLILAKSVGTFARALDCNNAFKQPSLPLSAAAASRDITLVGVYQFILLELSTIKSYHLLDFNLKSTNIVYNNGFVKEIDLFNL